ncbi:aromatic ring-hydroxylating oxygenase subunit alpha [Mycobacteroides abscessus]|uniref:aromatic ring-hydroxylating oxygenase subunit alpha n=1 Tax=Mycobacteroides abscessus TaxID=36809 RepID=UPI000927CA05|nr:SRPBCC family protein [Mycobacteroides abscessus]MDO3333970.1 SRPBCC family protein [Mycobacteroides abscessus subsp. bolletii]QSM91460.1 Rieske 2Fe-2S domain-containing protein [Mycobacteroides abscessus subsp. bolletii]SIB91857.1 dioxygenase subunit alpha yeaW [Mycobacteroides abscessus subsp. bolletii]SKS85659.1 dioxygenase subunit alpha yeaW [Mycobacteroides abscessus subsp. bolletii]SKT09750.1 dioxygenase subunit alpha yeaW [Mycobacteroides abscessus subsp. bolletii]
MTRQESLDLTRRALKHFENNSLDVADDIWREPREAFVDQTRFDAEMAMLRRTPHVIGWVGEVGEPGQYTTKDVLGVPVLVTRGRDGALRAFVNGCAHRGAQVAAQCGKTRMFTCPYHGWTYGLDGRLTGVPARKMFSGALDDRALIPLPVSDQAGLIVVGLGPDVEMTDLLGDAAESLGQYDFATRHHAESRQFTIATNWKLAVDVNFEGYHFPYVHADTLDPIATNNSVCDVFGQNNRWAFPFRDLVNFKDLPESEWPDQFFGTVVYGLFPSCVLIEAPASYQMLRIYPGCGPAEAIVHITYGSPEPITTDEQRDWYRMSMDAVCKVLCEQDFPMAEACQRGLEGGVPEVVFGRNEPLLHHLASQWDRALRALT